MMAPPSRNSHPPMGCNQPNRIGNWAVLSLGRRIEVLGQREAGPADEVDLAETATAVSGPARGRVVRRSASVSGGPEELGDRGVTEPGRRQDLLEQVPGSPLRDHSDDHVQA